jgi:hypothetical protein
VSLIFINYRRHDAAGHAGRLYDRLAEAFGEDFLFMDMQLRPGEKFGERILGAVVSSDIVLAFIGPEWLTLQDERGRRKLDDPEDYVRAEIGTALRHNIPVVPILVGGARVPPSNQLPEDIRDLVSRQAAELTDNRWDYDTGQLIEALRDQLSIQVKPAESAATRHPDQIAEVLLQLDHERSTRYAIFEAPDGSFVQVAAYPNEVPVRCEAVDFDEWSSYRGLRRMTPAMVTELQRMGFRREAGGNFVKRVEMRDKQEAQQLAGSLATVLHDVYGTSPEADLDITLGDWVDFQLSPYRA